jgi:hypothetical protein
MVSVLCFAICLSFSFSFFLSFFDKTLRLRADNKIGDDGATAMAGAVRANKSIKSIDWESENHNYCASVFFSKSTLDAFCRERCRRQIQALTDALKSNKTVKALRLDSASGCFVLASSFATSSEIRRSRRRKPNRRRRRASAGRMLEKRQVDSGAGIGLLVVCFFFFFFFFGCDVPIISCADNQIGDDGAKALADMLKSNATLTRLTLRCESILSIVFHMTRIAMIVDNRFSQVAAQMLVAACESNTAVISLELSGAQQMSIAIANK